MLYKTKRTILHKGDRIRKGAVIDLTEEDVQRIDPSEIARLEDEPVSAPVEEVKETPLSEASHEELRKKAALLGLKTTGSKASLVERITLHLEGKTDETEQAEGNEENT